MGGAGVQQAPSPSIVVARGTRYPVPMTRSCSVGICATMRRLPVRLGGAPHGRRRFCSHCCEYTGHDSRKTNPNVADMREPALLPLCSHFFRARSDPEMDDEGEKRRARGMRLLRVRHECIVTDLGVSCVPLDRHTLLLRAGVRVLCNYAILRGVEHLLRNISVAETPSWLADDDVWARVSLS